MQNQNIKEIALRTIGIEQTTIGLLHASITDEFVSCIRSLHDSPGRIVVTGIGKSAIVAQKIVATLNSTGSPALFMHAADAIHGDLGMVQREDSVICISKSGETPEIKALVPLVKVRAARLIAMVSQADSYLGRHADFILLTPVPEEADPNNLAPTASTTAQMAMGDVLAVTLLSMRGFSPSDFASFHPGGSLGKYLYLRVSDIFPKNAKPSVLADTPLREVIISITTHRLGATVVTDGMGFILGIITDGDIRRMLQQRSDFSQVLAQDIMSAGPKTIPESELAANALLLMRQHSITQLVVVDEHGHYSGIIHLHDLIREGII